MPKYIKFSIYFLITYTIAFIALLVLKGLIGEITDVVKIVLAVQIAGMLVVAILKEEL